MTFRGRVGLGQDGGVRMTQRFRRLSLRSRVTLLFLLLGIGTSLFLSAASYFTARSYLLERRDEVVERQAFNNAQLIRSQLRNRRSEAFELISGVRTEQNGFAILHLSPENLYFSQEIRFTQSALPADLVDATLNGLTARQRFTLDGQPYAAVGVYIAEIGAHYFEAFPLSDERRTLNVIASALVIGVLAIGVLATLVGWWVSRRLLRPLERVSEAAGEIAGGGLDTRLEQEDDPDLSRLITSFNDMADAVQTRIERETRFASDVSHELRSPITALAAAVEVLDARRADLSVRTQQALDVVVSQVRRFDQMVLDLLELSRMDVGVIGLHREDIDIVSFLERVGLRYGVGELNVVVGEGAPTMVSIDKRRFERIMANLFDNARLHGGGVSKVGIEQPRPGIVRISVEDRGPGVAPSERALIFERFARGSAGRSRAGGTGLGLALVAEHTRAHGGVAWVEDAPHGGARFVVEIPE
jgi:two-component system, OmpR family, sensor histidine kinase MtrB